MTSKHSKTFQTSQTCSFAKLCPMLHLEVACEVASPNCVLCIIWRLHLKHLGFACTVAFIPFTVLFCILPQISDEKPFCLNIYQSYVLVYCVSFFPLSATCWPCSLTKTANAWCLWDTGLEAVSWIFVNLLFRRLPHACSWHETQLVRRTTDRHSCTFFLQVSDNHVHGLLHSSSDLVDRTQIQMSQELRIQMLESCCNWHGLWTPVLPSTMAEPSRCSAGWRQRCCPADSGWLTCG